MNLDHLKYFVDAARSGGVSQSARNNFISQSAISRAISKLESDLGVDLVIHKQNSFQLTDAGKEVLEKGFAVLDAVRHLQDVSQLHNKTLRGSLKFGCNQAIASRLIGPLLEKVEKKYPDLKPEMMLGNTDQIQNMLENYEIDFGIVMSDGVVDKIYQTHTVYKSEFIVVRSPRYKKTNPFEDFIVSRTKNGGMSQKYMDAYHKAYGKSIKPKLVIASWQVIMDLAISGYGCALVPRFLCANELKAKTLEELKHKVGPIPFKLCTIVKAGRSLPRNAQAIVESLANS